MGTLCIIDDKPRDFTSADNALLSDLGMLAQQELQAIQLATIDELTKISNRRGFQMLAEHSLAMDKRLTHSATLLFFDLNKFKQINDNFGHQQGDAVLRYFADCMLLSFRDSDVIGRLGGDEFVVLLSNHEDEDVKAALSRFADNLEEINGFASVDYDIEYSVGVLHIDDLSTPLDDLLHKADELMYKNKPNN
jgi:diguanylate cyclase (GGDEF)-like protein